MIDEKLRALVEQSEKLNTRYFLKKKDLGFDERAEKGISEIFAFYAKQNLTHGKFSTFETMDHQTSTLNLAPFIKFCQDFQIPLPKQVIYSIQSHNSLFRNSKKYF